MTNAPVCGKQVDERKAPARTNYQGQDHHFCSQDCKRKFDEHPTRYVAQQTKSGNQQQRGGGAA